MRKYCVKTGKVLEKILEHCKQSMLVFIIKPMTDGRIERDGNTKYKEPNYLDLRKISQRDDS